MKIVPALIERHYDLVPLTEKKAKFKAEKKDENKWNGEWMLL